MPDDPQKPTNWTPTPKQLDLLNAAKEPGLKRSITAICKRAHVDRTSYYDWMREDPGFRAAWAKVWEEALDYHFPAVVTAMLRKGRDGDTRAARLVAELKGVLTKRIEVTGQSGGPVQVVDLAKLTPEQLEAIVAIAPEVIPKPGGDGH